MAKSKSEIIFQGLDETLEEALTPPVPKAKMFRILNKTNQILYINMPQHTLAIRAGKSADVPESYVINNHHLKVMVQRGHVALFEHE